MERKESEQTPDNYHENGRPENGIRHSSEDHDCVIIWTILDQSHHSISGPSVADHCAADCPESFPLGDHRLHRHIDRSANHCQGYLAYQWFFSS